MLGVGRTSCSSSSRHVPAIGLGRGRDPNDATMLAGIHVSAIETEGRDRDLSYARFTTMIAIIVVNM